MTVQRVDVIYIHYKFHSVPCVAFYAFGASRQRVEIIRTRFADPSGATS